MATSMSLTSLFVESLENLSSLISLKWSARGMKTQSGIFLQPSILYILSFTTRYFNRDVECIRTFFRRRFQYESVLYPKFSRTIRNGLSEEGFRLDAVVAASGFGNKEMSILEKVSSIRYTSGRSFD